MTTRRSILIGTAAVAGAALWYLFRPDALVISKTVSEPLAAENHVMSSHAPSMAQSGSAMTDSHAEPAKVSSGRFHTNAHETQGLATIYRLEDGRRILRLTEFATSNGPDVRVYHARGPLLLGHLGDANHLARGLSACAGIHGRPTSDVRHRVRDARGG